MFDSCVLPNFNVDVSVTIDESHLAIEHRERVLEHRKHAGLRYAEKSSHGYEGAKIRHDCLQHGKCSNQKERDWYKLAWSEPLAEHRHGYHRQRICQEQDAEGEAELIIVNIQRLLNARRGVRSAGVSNPAKERK